MKRAITIGNFDGVHRGHKALIDAVNTFKREQLSSGVAWCSMALTFEPHPIEVLRPGVRVPRLTTREKKVELLHQSGVDQVEVLEFNDELAQMPAEVFFESLLINRFNLGFLVVGENFFFGKNRTGTPEVLQKWCSSKSISCKIIPPIQADGATISSSRIRALIEQGQMIPASRLLGRDYSLTGVVVHGDKRGRQLGFPTANVIPQTQGLGSPCLPAKGVYLSFATLEGRTFPSITNVGVKPTVARAGAPLIVETHLLDFEGDLYEKLLTVEFRDRLRDERRFGGVEELRQQIQIDTAIARQKLRSL